MRKPSASVKAELTETLKPGDIVMLDNLGSHKAKPSATRQGRRRKAILPAAL